MGVGGGRVVVKKQMGGGAGAALGAFWGVNAGKEPARPSPTDPAGSADFGLGGGWGLGLKPFGSKVVLLVQGRQDQTDFSSITGETGQHKKKNSRNTVSIT